MLSVRSSLFPEWMQEAVRNAGIESGKKSRKDPEPLPRGAVLRVAWEEGRALGLAERRKGKHAVR